MDSSHPATIMSERVSFSTEEQLSELFGSYKAEWLKERLFDYFTTPDYLPELMTSRPCVLVGGRGTGKTTVLRGLSYEGQFALSGSKADKIRESRFYGLYLRVNTNRVMAFTGPEVEHSTWVKLFGHYVNLLLCDLVLKFLDWYKIYTNADFDLDWSLCRDISNSLQIDSSDSILELSTHLNSARLKFEAYINNVADGNRPPISMQGAPIDALFDAIGQASEFAGKTFFFLVDEYENFEDYQQQVLNTLVKHAGNNYTFKIGVRELGWRVRSTLNANEQLISPADYVRINIVEKLQGDTFKRFASSVCNARLARLDVPGLAVIRSIEEALPGMSEEEEAVVLGVNELATEIKSGVAHVLAPNVLHVVNQLTPLQLWVLRFWADSQKVSIEDVLVDYAASPESWAERFNNYKHASLYRIRRRKRGIRKYYAGFDVFCQLAAGNIRYLIELVDQSLLRHLRDQHPLSAPVTPESQTTAAQNVGKKNLSELEGLSVHGAQLTKLVLGLGRVFQVMAAQPEGHAPEVNQFHLTDDGQQKSSDVPVEVDNLLKAAVMHLALIRFPANKLADEGETRDYDYLIHPVFSAFFVFSYRKKRKMLLSANDLLGLVKSPQEYIPRILAKQHRSNDEELPEQVLLFEAYYGRRSR